MAKERKDRYSVTLSSKTATMVSDIKESTDADSDSEVFRNAIRLTYAILLAQRNGNTLNMEDKEGNKTIIPIMETVPEMLSS